MKSHEETAAHVLKRRDEYLAERKRRGRRITTAAACLCLCALVGVGAWQSGMLTERPAPAVRETEHDTTDHTAKETEPKPTDSGRLETEEPVNADVNETASPDTQEDTDESTAPIPEEPLSKDRIVVHPIDGLSAPVYSLFHLALEDHIGMDAAELNAYYGAALFGQAPDGWREHAETGGIFRREKGTGELYWDVNSVTYSDEGGGRSFWILAVKECRNWLALFDFISDGEKSVINGRETAIGQTADGAYQVEFLLNGTAIRVVATGFTEEELVSALASLQG